MPATGQLDQRRKRSATPIAGLKGFTRRVLPAATGTAACRAGDGRFRSDPAGASPLPSSSASQETPGCGNTRGMCREAFAEAVEALLAPAVASPPAAQGCRGLDQQLAAAFQQSRPGRQATGKVFVEQGELHQGVETTEPRGRIQLAVGQAPEATAARRAEFDRSGEASMPTHSPTSPARHSQPRRSRYPAGAAARAGSSAGESRRRWPGGGFPGVPRARRGPTGSALPRQLRSSRRLRSMGSAQGFAAAEVARGRRA